MRIISGKFKGKKIYEPKDKTTRPLKDLTKESIFNVIEHSNKINVKIENSNILDLFSGVGSFGLECLSRGAKNVYFVENYNDVVKILKKNITSLRLEEYCYVINQNAFTGIDSRNFENNFDIVFLDPPYKEKNIHKMFTIIHQEEILNKKNLVIIHRHKNEIESYPDYFQIQDKREYGISKIIFGCINY
tara:strand:- start:2466 stop:3032 length:567 start_codon:yes stop_codon:yes gene_type:complete